jgi:hypothetical protein
MTISQLIKARRALGPAGNSDLNAALSRKLSNSSVQALINVRKNEGGPGKVPNLNIILNKKLKNAVRSMGYNPGPERIRRYTNYLKDAGNLNWRYDLADIIRQKVSNINRNSSNPRRAKERLAEFKSGLRISYFGANSNVSRIFANAERNYNRRINEERRQRMNANRNKRGLPPLPNRSNNLPGPVFRPPPNAPPAFRPPNAAPPSNFRPPPNMPPPLNMGEQRAISNVPGGANAALNLVQNAGGPNNVLKAANQIKEAGGDPVAAIAHGANAKNVKIVLQLGGANNAAKVATAAPKLARRRRRSKKTKAKGKGRPRVSAIKKLLRSLPKKKLLSILPKSNKNSFSNKNKTNVATRVTSYLTGRTKKK